MVSAEEEKGGDIRIIIHENKIGAELGLQGIDELTKMWISWTAGAEEPAEERRRTTAVQW